MLPQSQIREYPARFANSNSVTGILASANMTDATVSVKGIVQLAGDLGGTAALPSVLKINGSSVPAGGALVTGTVLRATGTSTLAYGSVDLANSSAVTGVLPSANLFQATTGTSGAVKLANNLGGTAALPTVVDLTIAGQATGSLIYFNGTNWVNLGIGTDNQLLRANSGVPNWATVAGGGGGSFAAGGDLSGSDTSQVVEKIHGAVVPIAGSLTTGNGLYVTGTSALSYSALNLAGGSDYVTGVLPSVNMTDATTGVKGIVQLAGNLGGTAASPTVVDLTIAGQATNSMLYFNGTNWISLGAGSDGYYLKSNSGVPTWTTSGNKGSVEVDFGGAIGDNIATAIITGQSGISSSSDIRVYIAGDTSTDFNIDEHQFLSSYVGVTYSNVITDVGFTITAITELRLSGKLLVRWSWS